MNGALHVEKESIPNGLCHLVATLEIISKGRQVGERVVKPEDTGGDPIGDQDVNGVVATGDEQ